MKNGTSLYLDLVRFAAALIVFFEHLREITTNGFNGFWKLYPRLFAYLPGLAHTAVIVFFVLSGYVIAHVRATRERTALEFAASRFARLYSVVLPALILVAIVNYLVALRYPTIFDRSIMAHSGIPPIFFYLASSIFVNHFWLWPDLEPPNIPLWSLSFEAAYYVGIALFLFARGSIRPLALILLSMAAGPTIVLLAPTWLLGYLAYHHSQHRQLHVGFAAVLWVGSIFLLLLCPFIELGMPQRLAFLKMPDPTLGNLLSSYAAAICFTLGLAAFSGISEMLEPLLGFFAKPIRWLGSITFALYLFHAPLLELFNVYSLPDRSSFGQLVLLVGGTFLVVGTFGRFCDQSKGAYKRFFLSLCRRGSDLGSATIP